MSSELETVNVEVDYPSAAGAQCPFPLFEQLRDSAPVQPHPARPDLYLISRYDDVRWVFAHPEIFASANSRAGLAGVDWALAARQSVSMLESDAPDLKAKRDLALAAVKPGRLRLYDTKIRALADELIDAFIDRGRCNFVEEFARPLPMRFTLWLMGVGDDQIEFIRTWGKFESSGLTFMSHEFQEQQKRNGERMTEFLTSLLEERYANPGDDVVSLVIAQQVARDGRFDLPEVRSQLVVLLAGGINTTAQFLSNMLVLLIENPDVLARVRHDTRQLGRAIEECLRLEGPTVWVSRYVKSDVELSGVRIPAGSFVALLLASANRDPRHFECPSELVVDRAGAHDHVAFGYGAHFCVGAPLARLELRIAFEALLNRLGDIRLAADNDFRRIPSASHRGYNALSIEFTSLARGG